MGPAMGESVSTKRVVSAYEKLAPIYDWLWRGYLEGTFRVALDVLRLTGTERILDVACGTGEFERRVVAQFPRQQIVGVDITEAMLQRARVKLAGAPHVEFQRAASQALPVPDAGFDIVINCSALHYMREPERFFAEAARALRPGGRCIVIDWRRDAWRGKLYDLVRRLTIRAHHRVFTVAEVTELCRTAGLRPTTIRTFSVRGVWSMMCIESCKPTVR